MKEFMSASEGFLALLVLVLREREDSFGCALAFASTDSTCEEDGGCDEVFLCWRGMLCDIGTRDLFEIVSRKVQNHKKGIFMWIF